MVSLEMVEELVMLKVQDEAITSYGMEARNFKDGCGEFDAAIRIGVVGRVVRGLSGLVAGLLQGGEELLVLGGETVVGGDDEDWPGGELFGELYEVPAGSVAEDLVAE